MVNIETSATNPLDNTAEFNEAKLKHAFQYNEQVLINSQIRVDRLDVEGTRKRFDWQGLSEERLIPANERAETYYQVIRETNSLVSASSGENLPDNGQNHSEAITSERIGYDLALLGGFYRRSLTTGLLTAYKLPDREIYEKTLKQIEDPVAHKRQEDYLKATYKSEIDARRRSGLAKEPVPGLLERTPVGLSDQDIESLLGEGEDVRREALAELLDPYRNRPDHGASQEEKEKAVEARLQVGVLLESLSPSWQRDLLAADTWRFYMHETINDQERANKAINLVSPNLRNSLLSLHEYLKTTTPESIVAGYKGQSERTLANLAIRTETDPQHLRAEAENEKNSMRVSINIGKSEPLTTVFKFYYKIIDCYLPMKSPMIAEHKLPAKDNSLKPEMGLTR